jgi:hypothetical protein
MHYYLACIVAKELSVNKVVSYYEKILEWKAGNRVVTNHSAQECTFTVGFDWCRGSLHDPTRTYHVHTPNLLLVCKSIYAEVLLDLRGQPLISDYADGTPLSDWGVALPRLVLFRTMRQVGNMHFANEEHFEHRPGFTMKRGRF